MTFHYPLRGRVPAGPLKELIFRRWRTHLIAAMAAQAALIQSRDRFPSSRDGFSLRVGAAKEVSNWLSYECAGPGSYQPKEPRSAPRNIVSAPQRYMPAPLKPRAVGHRRGPAVAFWNDPEIPEQELRKALEVQVRTLSRIFVALMTSDRKPKASRDGSE